MEVVRLGTFTDCVGSNKHGGKKKSSKARLKKNRGILYKLFFLLITEQ
jgi:hypothetical protein